MGERDTAFSHVLGSFLEQAADGLPAFLSLLLEVVGKRPSVFFVFLDEARLQFCPGLTLSATLQRLERKRSTLMGTNIRPMGTDLVSACSAPSQTAEVRGFFFGCSSAVANPSSLSSIGALNSEHFI